jgi:hypothetical protein
LKNTSTKDNTYVVNQKLEHVDDISFSEVAFAFDYSAKKLQALFYVLDADASTKENLEKRTKLRILCETR